MSPEFTAPPPRRARKVLKSSLVLGLMTILGILAWKQHDQEGGDGGTAVVGRLPVMTLPPMPPSLPESMAARKAYQRLRQDAMAHDGRVLEKGVAAQATGLVNRHSLQLALDEVFSLGRGEPAAVGRIRPRATRAELEKFVSDRVAGGAPATYPVLYVKDAPRVSGNLRVATGEIVAALQPGVSAGEIARAYGLEARPEGSSLVGLTRFVARNAFRALELVPQLAADARIAMVDHDFLKPVEPKSLVPNDPMFSDQWAVGSTHPYSIGIYPALSYTPLLPNAAPVWGDFDDAAGGIRGRGIRVGVLDDGVEINHPDLQDGMAPVGEHHGYDMRETFSPSGDVLPPYVQSSSGFNAEPLRVTPVNRAHGINIAGIIGGRANNGAGMVGVAPASTLVGVRTLSYALLGRQFEAPDPTFYLPLLGDLISPTQDVMIAAAFTYSANDFTAGSFNPGIIYKGTLYSTPLPGFADSPGGPLIHVKNVGFGASDNAGVVDGPGPETAGSVINGFVKEGARTKAVKDGRLGLGTVFVHPAGNARYLSMDNSNSDGYANAREAITVGSLAKTNGPIVGAADATSVFSEWGANLTVVAPGGGQYWGSKAAGQRTNDGRPMRGSPSAGPGITPIATTDWTINLAAKPATISTPSIPELYGLNKGGGNGAADYTDGRFSRRFQGTSAAAAHVSGVVALMLEANPRLSWIDVQNTLIRTARNHLDPLAYATDPTAANPPLNALDGLDTSDPSDPVVIDRDWFKNGGNLWFNHKYGAGLVDAGRAVAEAQRGILLPRQTDMVELEAYTFEEKIIEDAAATAPGRVSEITLDPAMPADFVITHVQVRIDKVSAFSIGELGITLISPSGMESTLLEPRYDFSDDLTAWTFSSLRYWGESGYGVNSSRQWKIQFRDYFRDDVPSPLSLMRVNPRGASNRVTLIVHGYPRPTIPTVTSPASINPLAPTVVDVPRGKNFSYSIAARNQPTTWFVRTDDAAGVPPGLKLDTANPSADGTYQPARRITGKVNAAVGTVYEVEVEAANAGGTSETHYLQLRVVPPPSADPYTQWADFFFPPFALGNPLAAGAADGDGDLSINEIEYALGTSPTVFDADKMPTVTLAEGAVTAGYTFKRFPTRGVKYEVQASTSLLTDSWKTVVVSDPALKAPEAGAGGLPLSVDAGYTVSEGALVPEGDEPQSSHHAVTVLPAGVDTKVVYFRLKLIPLAGPLDPK